MLAAHTRGLDRPTHCAQDKECAAVGLVHFRTSGQLHCASRFAAGQQSVVLQSELPRLPSQSNSIATCYGLEWRSERSQSRAINTSGARQVSTSPDYLQ